MNDGRQVSLLITHLLHGERAVVPSAPFEIPGQRTLPIAAPELARHAPHDHLAELPLGRERELADQQSSFGRPIDLDLLRSGGPRDLAPTIRTVHARELALERAVPPSLGDVDRRIPPTNKDRAAHPSLAYTRVRRDDPARRTRREMSEAAPIRRWPPGRRYAMVAPFFKHRKCAR